MVSRWVFTRFLNCAKAQCGEDQEVADHIQKCVYHDGLHLDLIADASLRDRVRCALMRAADCGVNFEASGDSGWENDPDGEEMYMKAIAELRILLGLDSR